jgi:tRNA(Leu) C34 or U34 (ribose-2'-O)-methylase TrmL
VSLDCTDDSIIAELLAAVDDHLKANTGRLTRVCELLQAPFEAVRPAAFTSTVLQAQLCKMVSQQSLVQSC